MGKREHFYSVGGNVIGIAIIENSMEKIKIKIELPSDPAISLLDLFLEKTIT